MAEGYRQTDSPSAAFLPKLHVYEGEGQGMVSTYLDATRPEAEQAVTHEGGLVYAADKWTRLRRFLILGTQGGTFYVGERDLTLENVDVVRECLDEDWLRTISEIATVSDQGLAPKNDAAIFALAMASVHTNESARKHALAILPGVCRIGTHLLHFSAYREALGGGWGRGVRRAVGSWFVDRSAKDMAYQAVKYPSRDGWALSDLLRLSHPKLGGDYATVAKYILGKEIHQDEWSLNLSDEVRSFLAAHIWVSKAGRVLPDVVARIVREERIPREAVATEYLNDPNVWDALLEDMPITATIRNLGKMTKVGLIDGKNGAAQMVADRLTRDDGQLLRKGRVHPIAILAALKIYERGHGEKGSLEWNPSKVVINALDEAFYLAFGAVESTEKHILLALDVSSSMDGNKVNGMSFLDARMASAAMALVTAATEPRAEFVAYSHEIVPLKIRPSMRLDEVVRAMKRIPYGGTYCSLPFAWARHEGKKFDAIVSYTDNQTMDTGSTYGGYGNRRPLPMVSAALQEYRQFAGKGVRSAVCAFASNGFTIADPTDAGQLDFVGIDASMPMVLAQFIKGEL